jgi:hypothetical protein
MTVDSQDMIERAEKSPATRIATGTQSDGHDTTVIRFGL